MPDYVPTVDSPALAPIKAYQGDTFTRTWSLRTNTNGVYEAINCTGYSVRAELKRVRGSDVAVIETSSNANAQIAYRTKPSDFQGIDLPLPRRYVQTNTTDTVASDARMEAVI